MTPSSNHSNISGDELSDLKRYVLEASRKLLVENVDAPRFLPYFRSRFILDQRECDQVKSCSRQSRYDGAEKLLDALLTKGGDGYDHFCAAIMYDRTQMFLLTALNKRLEILKEWRKNQVVAEQKIQRAQVEMQQRVQAQATRQHLYANRTYPMMTAAYSGMRQPHPPAAAAAGTGRMHLPTFQHHHQHHLNPAPPERLARSPIPTEEMEPMAPPPNVQFPHPHQLQRDYYNSQFSDHHHHQQLAQHQAQLPHHNQHHHSQQIYHPSTHPSATQPPPSQAIHHIPGSGYSSNYPPQPPLQGPYGCVPPPAPMEAVYPVPMEGRTYHEPYVPHHNVLMLNTPTGAMMENLLPGMPPPPTGSANTCAAAQAMPPATTAYYRGPEGEAAHRLTGSSPQHTHNYGLLSSTAATYGGSSKDLLCGQGGN